jgi:hypothetical protein
MVNPISQYILKYARAHYVTERPSKPQNTLAAAVRARDLAVAEKDASHAGNLDREIERLKAEILAEQRAAREKRAGFRWPVTGSDW